MRSLAVLLILLAGCAQPVAVQPVEDMVVHGIVVDGAIRPVPGATVTIGNHTADVDEDGNYRLQGNFTVGDLVVAHAPGHTAQSRLLERAAPGITAALNFSLDAINDARYTDTQKFAGLIACGIIVQVGHSHGSGDPGEDSHYDCPSLAEDHSRFEYIPEDNPDDMLIEMFWEPNNQYAARATIVLRDDAGDVIAFEEGTSPLRIEVAAALVEEHFQDRNGIIEVLPGIPHESIGDVFLGAHLDQRFDIYATTFHGSNMPAHWTIN